MELGPPAPRSLCPCELLQLHSTCLAGVTLRIGSPGEEWVAAPLGVAVWASRASSLLPLAKVGGTTHSQLLGCATPLLQNSLGSRGH